MTINIIFECENKSSRLFIVNGADCNEKIIKILQHILCEITFDLNDSKNVDNVRKVFDDAISFVLSEKCDVGKCKHGEYSLQIEKIMGE